MKSKPCGRRSREQGGIFLVIFVAIAVGMVLVAGVWVFLKVRSLVQRINNNKDHAMVVQSVPRVRVAQLTAQATNDPVVVAPPREPILTVLESTNLLDWTHSPLSLEELIHNLNNRINLTNSQCFYRIAHE